MSNLAAALRDRGLKLAAPDVIKDCAFRRGQLDAAARPLRAPAAGFGQPARAPTCAPRPPQPAGEDVIRQFSLSVDEFIDSAESATFAANAQMLTKTAVEGIRANWVRGAAGLDGRARFRHLCDVRPPLTTRLPTALLSHRPQSKKAATRGVRPGGPMGMKTPGPGANRFDRSNADGMPGFSATSVSGSLWGWLAGPCILPALISRPPPPYSLFNPAHPTAQTATPAGQMAGAKRPYGDVSGSSAARSGGGFSATSSAVPPGARTGGGNFASPPATAARPGAAAGARPAGAGAGSSAAAAPPAAGAGSASGPDAYYSRKNRGEVLETYTPTSAIAQAAAAAATPGSPLAAGGTTDAGLNEAAMAAAANKPYTRPSVQTLRGLGYRTFRNISELVRGSGASGSSKAATLAATEPLPLVVPSLTKWAEVTGMRVGLPPLPAPPVTADSGSGGAAAASPAGSTSPQQLGGASGSPLSNTSPGSTGAGAGAGAGSSPPSAAAGLDTSFTSVDGSGGGADDAAVGPPPDTRRFELPAQRSVEGPYQYMYTTLAKRAEALEERLAEVGDAILEAHGLAGLLEPLGTVSQSPLVYVGRVVVDGEGKINATSVLLEGTAADPLPGGVASRNPFLKCGRILLDLRDVPAFSLFPGQVVAVKGLNTSGDKMVVQQVYTAAPLPLPVTPVDNMRVLADAASSSIDRAGPLRMVVAAGPYTLAADWKFSPLADMLAAVAVPKAGEPPPDVIVLVRGGRCGGGATAVFVWVRRSFGCDVVPVCTQFTALRLLPSSYRRWAPLWTRSTPPSRVAATFSWRTRTAAPCR